MHCGKRCKILRSLLFVLDLGVAQGNLVNQLLGGGPWVFAQNRQISKETPGCWSEFKAAP